METVLVMINVIAHSEREHKGSWEQRHQVDRVRQGVDGKGTDA